MAVDQELWEMMPFQVTLRPPASMDPYGQKTFGNPITVEHAAIDYGEQYVKSDPSKTVFAQGVIYLDDVYPMTTEWEVGVPQGGPYGEVVKVMKIVVDHDEKGPYATVLYIGAK